MWTNKEEADRLKVRFMDVPNRSAFAREFGVPGGGAMIYQHINGIKPISVDAAKAYARGFGCSLKEISPRIAAEISSASKHLLPLSDIRTSLNNAESVKTELTETAMLLNFPKMAPETLSSDDHIVIPQYATGGAMGYGLTLPDQPGVIQNWSVSREWISKNIKTHSGLKNLCIVTGFGPSMQPMFNPGDPLLVDTGVGSVIAEGIYFFRVGNEGFVKQLQKIPTASGLKYIAKSKNPDYDNFEITPDMDFEVLGKVVRVWCGTDF